MLNHLDIWGAIDQLAQKLDLSASGLAKRAGLDPTSFNPSKRISPDGKPRWPTTESISKILHVGKMSMQEFAQLVGDARGEYATPAPSSVPLIGFAEAGTDGFFDDAGFPVQGGWEEVTLPHLRDANSYALEISGDSMEPVYRDGDIVIVSPHTEPRKGDRVIVKTHDGQIMAKELSRITATKVDLKSLNPAHDDISFNRRDLAWIARVMWVSQ